MCNNEELERAIFTHFLAMWNQIRPLRPRDRWTEMDRISLDCQTQLLLSCKDKLAPREPKTWNRHLLRFKYMSLHASLHVSLHVSLRVSVHDLTWSKHLKTKGLKTKDFITVSYNLWSWWVETPGPRLCPCLSGFCDHGTSAGGLTANNAPRSWRHGIYAVDDGSGTLGFTNLPFASPLQCSDVV